MNTYGFPPRDNRFVQSRAFVLPQPAIAPQQMMLRAQPQVMQQPQVMPQRATQVVLRAQPQAMQQPGIVPQQVLLRAQPQVMPQPAILPQPQVMPQRATQVMLRAQPQPQQQPMQNLTQAPSFYGSYKALANPFSQSSSSSSSAVLRNLLESTSRHGYYNRPYHPSFPNPSDWKRDDKDWRRNDSDRNRGDRDWRKNDNDWRKNDSDWRKNDKHGDYDYDRHHRPPSELTGDASIKGNEFRTLDGEVWSPAVREGKTYNLLSTDKLQINGSYETQDGELVLDQAGILTENGQIALSSDGTLLVDGKPFRKGKNDLDGTLTKNGDSYTLTTSEGYVIKLDPDRNSGIMMDIDAKNVKVGAGGLLGSANDGVQDSASELKQDLKPGDFEVEDALTFNDRDTLQDDERKSVLWNARNPKYNNTSVTIDSSGFGFSADGDKIANWKMKDLKADKAYLLFSEQDLSVSGTFGSAGGGDGQELKSVGLVVDGLARKVLLNENGHMEVRDKNDHLVKIPGFSGNIVTFPITNDDGESYEVTVVRTADAKLELKIDGKNVGENAYRNGGLLGDAVGARSDNGDDDNGAGYIRDEDGGLSESGSEMKSALTKFELSGLFDVNSDRGVDDITEALEPNKTPATVTYRDVKGRTWGDPHFDGADGEKYDIQGKSGDIYNIVSDKGVQVNALWDKFGDDGITTVMRKFGFNVNGQQLEVGMDREAKKITYKLDGKEVTPENMPKWMSLDGDKLVVTSDQNGEKWKFVVSYTKSEAGDYLDLDSSGIEINNEVETGGIWGHSIGENDLYKGNGEYQKGGGGIIRNADGTTLAFDKKEGSEEHTAALANYKETDLFSTGSHWSQFDK
jgi:hypothetical protein